MDTNRRGRTKATRRLERRPWRMEQIALADTPAGRVGAAAAYVRSAFGAAPRDEAELVADAVVRELIAAGDELLKTSTRGTS
jgi:hypothetical protein